MIGLLYVGLSLAAMNANAHNPHDPVLALGVSPNFASDGTLFLGTFAAMNWSYKNILRSTDGGASWTKLPNGMDNRSDISAIRLSPNYSSDHTVYATTRGDGVYQSTDRGDSWRLINSGLTSTNIKALRIGGSAGADYVLFAAPSAGGLFRRAHSASSWTRSLPASIGVNAFATSPDFSVDGTVFAADGAGLIRVSKDGGATWTNLGNPVAAIVYDIAVAPGRAKNVFLATSRAGVFYSSDGGVTFVNKRSGLPAEAVNRVAVSPNFLNDHTVFCTTVTRSVYKSTNGGDGWTLYSSHAAITGQTSALTEFSELQVSSTYTADRAVFLSAFDGLFISVNGGANWRQIQTRRKVATGIAFSPHFIDDRRVMASVYSERGLYSSSDRGSNWSLVWDGWPQPGNSLSAFDLDFVQNHVGSPLAVATRNRSNIGFTSDFGASWKVLTLPKLPVAAPREVYVTSLGVSPAFDFDQEIYLGTRAHGVIQTRDGGTTWRSTGGPTGQITKVALSPNYANDHTVFVGSLGGQVWRSQNAGDSWTRVGTAAIKLRGGLKYTWVAVSPRFKFDHLVLVGTNNGIYRSIDGGTSWQTLGSKEVGSSTVVHQIEFAPAAGTDLTFYAVVRGRGLMRVVVHATGTIVSVSNVGAPLLAQNVEFADFRLSPAFNTDATIIGVSGEDVYRSTNRGATWARVGTPAGSY